MAGILWSIVPNIATSFTFILGESTLAVAQAHRQEKICIAESAAGDPLRA